jgi:Cu(I)/Ag(I) efflux system membrane fusion protein
VAVTGSPKVLAAVAGLVLGAAVVLLLPSTWLFVEKAPPGTHAGSGHVKYACPMFCVVMEDLPADGRCPVCGMDLAEISGESRLDPAERRMIGLETARLRRVPLSRTVRVVGEVDYDETRLSRITTRMAGWLEKVMVTTTWERVEQSEPLASIYSPELYAAQREYLVAWRGAEGGEGDAPLLAAAERRLGLLGIGEKEIAKLRETGEVQQALVLRAPRSGVVVEGNAIEGAAVEKGATLYRIADLSRVWIQSEVFERDLPWVRVGQEATLEMESLPDGLTGRIAFIDPVIDRMSRTARVRIEVENPAGSDETRPLRIGQRVDAWIRARVGPEGDLVPPGEEPRSDPLAVPKSAVLRTGERAIVYVLFTEMAEGSRDYRLDPDALPEVVYYELTEVRPGPLSRSEAGEELYPLRSGSSLPEGALVVSKGNLLLDSQAQLSGRPSLLFPEGSRGGGHDHSGH